MALYSKITKSDLVNRFGEENIFRYYFGDFIVGKAYSSYFSKDGVPSTGFYYNKHGSLIYNDFRTAEKLDFVKFVQKDLGLDYYEALHQIAVDFNLVKAGVKTYNKEFVLRKKRKIKPKTKPIFTIKIKDFSKEELNFWQQYYITKEELITNNIVSVEWFKINSEVIFPDSMCFAYIMDGENGDKYCKIYTPFGKFKWYSNVPLDAVQGLNKLERKSDTLIITKSLKDYIVLKKYFTDVIYTQNESKAALKATVIRVLKRYYKNIIVWYDMDKPGIKAANYYFKTHNFKPVFTSITKNIWQSIMNAKKYNTKDPSDFIKAHGKESFEKYLKYIKLI